MSIAQYDEEPFPYQVERYDDLGRGQWVEVRQNDVKLPVGARGVVLRKIAETGNYQVAVEVEGEAQKRVVALCQDQVRPIEPPIPQEPMAAAEPETPATGDRMSAEGRERQRQATKAYWERKKAERGAEAAKPKPKRRTAPADIEAQIEATSAKLAEQAAGILNMPPDKAARIAPSLMTRHRPEGMDERIAEAVHGAPEPEKPARKLTERPAPEPLPVAAVEPEPEPEPEVVAAIRHVQGYRERYAAPTVDPQLLDAIRGLQAAPSAIEEAFSKKWGRLEGWEIEAMEDYVGQRRRSEPDLKPVTWTKRAADAIRPVLAEAATGGADPVQLALLVETISYLEDGGRP